MKTPKATAPALRRRTDATITPDTPLLLRICTALNEPPRVLAASLGYTYDELAPLIAVRSRIADTYDDEVWSKVGAYIDERIALLMAARRQLDEARGRDAAKRAARIAKQRHMQPRKRPNG